MADDELLAAIYAEPELDAHRAVYADWLCDRGDPRGEFIHLQLAASRGANSAEATARMHALQRAHVKAWLGPLDRVLTRASVAFERGFPVRGRCKPGLRKPERYANEPGWASFEALDDPPLALVHALPKLRAISLERGQVFLLLRDGPPLPMITSLTVHAPTRSGTVLIGEELAAYEQTRTVPQLESLSLVYLGLSSPSHWRWHSNFPHLRRLSVQIAHDSTLNAHWASELRTRAIALDDVTLHQPKLELRLGHVEPGDWARADLIVAARIAWGDTHRHNLVTLAEHGVTRVFIRRQQLALARRIAAEHALALDVAAFDDPP
jgi:uncharacterized protein (TIGR02996 family)